MQRLTSPMVCLKFSNSLQKSWYAGCKIHWMEVGGMVDCPALLFIMMKRRPEGAQVASLKLEVLQMSHLVANSGLSDPGF